MKSIYSGQHKKLVLKLVVARKEAGLLQREAARLIHATQSYLSKIEAGQVRLDIIQLNRFAEIYHKPLDYFLEPPAAIISDGEQSGYVLSMGHKPGPAQGLPPSHENAMVWEVDNNDTITYMSPSAKNILGYDTSEMIGLSDDNFIPKEFLGFVPSPLGHDATGCTRHLLDQ